MGSQCSNCTVVCQKDRQEIVHENAISIIQTNQNQMSQQSSAIGYQHQPRQNGEEKKYKKKHGSYQNDADYEDQVIKIQALYRGFKIRNQNNKKLQKQSIKSDMQGTKDVPDDKMNTNLPSNLKKNSIIDKQTSLDSAKSKKYKYDDKELLEIKKQVILDVVNRQKRPLYKFASGASYEGEWLGYEKNGFGVQVWLDQARYEGMWLNNRANGKGKFFHSDGDQFDGTWVDDQAHGYGIYHHADSNVYKGYWKADQQHGYGVEVWIDDSKYEGEYYEGKKQGRGRYFWPDGSNYDGDWYSNMINGYGTYTWTDGRGYEGSWMFNKMHGKGVYSWKDGRKYEGEYQEDKKHGWGIYTWVDGRKYEGHWSDGKQHGQGKYLQSDGKYKIGVWDKGKRTQWIEDTQ